jgi:hypothetical protein
VAAAICLITAAAPAWSAEVPLVNTQNFEEVSTFSLSFDGLGFSTSNFITQTDYVLQVDTDTSDARFNSYKQNVEPLTLPGGFSTGDIVVKVVRGSSKGEFDVFTGTFSTSETYKIEFDGDLSAFGLTSPVLLPGDSVGSVEFLPDGSGRIAMDWEGEGQLPDPFNPRAFLAFSYSCSVRTQFEPEPIPLLSLDLVPAVAAIELPFAIENSMMSHIETAVDYLENDQGNCSLGVLNQMAHRVDVMTGSIFSQEDADEIIFKIDRVIELIESIPVTPSNTGC